jgi:hypothetical protein
MNREAIELAQASLAHYRRPVSFRSRLRAGPKRYLFAAAFIAAMFYACRALLPPVHAIIYPSVPIAPLIAVSVVCRLWFGIGAGRLAAALTGMVMGFVSYNQLLADPGVSIWVAGYTATLIGISVKSA